MKTAIVVHGGAGKWDLTSARLKAARSACAVAAAAGQSILQQGGSALDAVEAAARILEDEPTLDAGRGSYPNAEGKVEMDAFIMDGRNLDLGAVAAVTAMRHPISLARLVMTESAHALLAGAGAERFADSVAFPRCPESELLVPESVAAGEPPTGALGDTIGAVALDQLGNVAVATSTGGTRRKLPGRVGDSPLVGSGGYADNQTAAVSATGHGEALMKVVISKQVCDYIALGLSAGLASSAAIELLKNKVEGEGGVITVAANGDIGIAYNTVAMPHAWAVNDGTIEVGQ